MTSTGDGVTVIASNVVSNAKLATVATSTIKGRATAGTGNVEDLSASQVRTILNVADGAEVNVQSDWNAASGAANILNKPTLGTAAAQDATAFEAAGAIASHGAATSGVHGISTFGATLVDDTDAAAAQTTLGLVIGTHVLAPSGNGSGLTSLNPSFLGTGTGSVTVEAGGTNQNVEVKPSGSGLVWLLSSTYSAGIKAFGVSGIWPAIEFCYSGVARSRITGGLGVGWDIVISPSGGSGGVTLESTGTGATRIKGGHGTGMSAFAILEFLDSGNTRIGYIYNEPTTGKMSFMNERSGGLSFGSNGVDRFIVLTSGGTYFGNATPTDPGINSVFAESAFIAKSHLRAMPTTFASLPTPATAGDGAFANITDGATTTLGAVATGSGSLKQTVRSDGTDWRVFFTPV